jgi:hypothetical protein
MVLHLPVSPTTEHGTSNTSLSAQTSPRFGQTSQSFSWIPAARDLSLDAILNGTVCPSNPARPRRGITTRTIHHEPVLGYLKAPESSSPLTPLSSPSQQPTLHPLPSPVFARGHCSRSGRVLAGKHQRCRGRRVHGEQMEIVPSVLFSFFSCSVLFLIISPL